MPNITFKGNPIQIIGDLPALGSKIPPYTLAAADLSDAALSQFASKRKVLNIFPSIDTPVCANSVRQFNERAAALKNTVVLNISADLPFAQSRFCGSENIKNSISLSFFRSDFATTYGVKILGGPLAGLAARAVVGADENDVVIYRELVCEIAQEPDYDSAINALK